MEIIEITEENAEEFSGFLDEDVASGLGRVFASGIGAMDDSGNVRGAMVYELKNAERKEDTKSQIFIFAGDDDAVRDALMDEYAAAIAEDDVAESFYESGSIELAHSLEAYGFSFDTSEALDVMITMDEIRSVGAELNISSIPSHIVSLSEVSVPLYRDFVKKCISNGHLGLLEDIEYLPMGWFDRELSSCSVSDNRMDGALLIKKAPSGLYHILLFTAFGADFEKKLALMMAYSIEKAIKSCPEDTNVILRRHNPSAKRFSDRFFAKRRGDEVYVGSRDERARG